MAERDANKTGRGVASRRDEQILHGMRCARPTYVDLRTVSYRLLVNRQSHGRRRVPTLERITMAKKMKRRTRRLWSKEDIRELKAHSRDKTPVAKIARMTKRSALALRQKAWQLGIALGHRR